MSLTGGGILTPQGDLETADLHIADGRIVESPAAEGLRIDCRGYCVMPGIVDADSFGNGTNHNLLKLLKSFELGN